MPICLFLGGDVMTGRGIDQVLPYPGKPILYERYVRDAREYVHLAEEVHGPIARPVSFDYVWGDALDELQQTGTAVRIINLETSITTCEGYWPDKDVLYRMHPQNIGCLTAAGIDCCCLANNHVLDWGYPGLEETLRTLNTARIACAGAGRNAREAAAPAVLDVDGKGRVLVFAFGSTTSGVPYEWGATEDQPGVNLLEHLSADTAGCIASQIRQAKRPGDVIVVSIHWGPNWGYAVPEAHIDFAHQLVENGVDIVHGHSSHHVKTIELYRGRLILYGCGDFLTDYEGIRGHARFRGDLALMCLVKMDPRTGQLLQARLVPLQSRRFRLSRVSAADAKWLCDILNTFGAPVGTQMELNDDNSMILR